MSKKSNDLPVGALIMIEQIDDSEIMGGQNLYGSDPSV